ncbi:MAG: FAD-dependent oxidoreductase [Verrucomicrobiales bacterium]|nr:FAD-dependent oxidoreductase [Verrucomicrobiales bacterium]
MATCAVMGQGIGTTAALAIQKHIPPADIATHPELMQQIQQQLTHDDAFLIPQGHPDSQNLIHQARIIAHATNGIDHARICRIVID